MNTDYTIQPVLMGGLVKEVHNYSVKVHLHGRLGVLTVPGRVIRGGTEPESGTEIQFYFSYFQVTDNPSDYDVTSVTDGETILPCYVGGVITEVNDTAVRVEITGHMGTAAVPRRWVFTDVKLREGLFVEFWFSGMKIIGKRNIPVESI